MNNIKMKFFGSLDDHQRRVNEAFSKIQIKNYNINFDNYNNKINFEGLALEFTTDEIETLVEVFTPFISTRRYMLYLWTQDFNIITDSMVFGHIYFKALDFQCSPQPPHTVIPTCFNIKFGFLFDDIDSSLDVKNAIKKLFVKSPRKTFKP